MCARVLCLRCDLSTVDLVYYKHKMFNDRRLFQLLWYVCNCWIDDAVEKAYSITFAELFVSGIWCSWCSGAASLRLLFPQCDTGTAV